MYLNIENKSYRHKLNYNTDHLFEEVGQGAFSFQLQLL